MVHSLLILGNRAFAEETADLARQTPPWEVAGFVENQERDRCQERLEGLPIHWLEDAGRLGSGHWAIGGLGTTHRGPYLRRAAELGFRFATLVHPRACVSPSVELGNGCLVSMGAMIASHTRLAEHVIVNRGALIGHHARIGPLCTIGPGANIAGRCRLGERVYVGMSAVIVNDVTIGEQCVIGAGAVVTHDLPPRVQVVGVPARVVRENVEGL